MEEKLMPDFDTRKPQRPNEPNRPRVPLLVNRLRGLLTASKHRNQSMAGTLSRSLMANKLRSLLIGGVLLLVIAPTLVGLLIYSFGDFPHPQQEARQLDPRCWDSFAQSTENSKPAKDTNDTQIAFTRSAAGDATESELYVMNADGTNETRLTNTSELYAKILATSPVWSPDGKRIAYLRGIDVDTGRTDRDIYVIDADGSNPSSLTTVEQSTFAWSPDGQKIAFDGWTRSGDSNGTPGIYLINPDGSGQEYLTDGSYPVWSPDSKKIAFLRGRRIYAMNADGTCETHLTDFKELTLGDIENGLAWSPDGKKIAFKSARSGNNDIYTINADGNGRTNLTNSDQSEDYFAWSPANVGTITERTEEAIEDRQAVDAAPEREELQAYIKQINELRERNLRGSEEGSEVHQLAYDETQQVLRGSDPYTKEKAVRFLARAGLLPSIPINFTDLRGTDLSGVNLSNANLSRAIIGESHFSGADLSGADLTFAQVTNDQLAQAESLAGATMPRGTQHP